MDDHCSIWGFGSSFSFDVGGFTTRGLTKGYICDIRLKKLLMGLTLQPDLTCLLSALWDRRSRDTTTVKQSMSSLLNTNPDSFPLLLLSAATALVRLRLTGAKRSPHLSGTARSSEVYISEELLKTVIQTCSC